MKTTIVLFALALVAWPTLAEGRQRRTPGHVVHTRRAPVVLHRAVPPFKGVHVYEPARR